MEKIKEIQESLNEIKTYSLLAAKNVLNVNDVILLTGFSKAYLYKLTCNREIPFYKPNGKQIYFDRAEIEAWLKQNRTATNEEIEQNAVNYIVTGKQQKGGNK